MRKETGASGHRYCLCAGVEWVSVHSLDDGSDALADANAHGCQAVTAAAFFHLVDQRCHDARAAAAERMAERDGAAVDVQFLQVDAELPGASQHLRGERLVDLDEIDLSRGET